MRLIRLLKHDLGREISLWAEEGVISTAQAEEICSRYGLDYRNLGRRSFGYQMLVGLGYLFIGLALITLIGANWDEIPRAVRMWGMILLTLGANLLGLIRFRRGQISAAVNWLFLGALFYGASIMLIAQIYHIDEHYPDGIFWWAMGVLPVAILMKSALLMLLAVNLGFIWFFVESFLDFYPVVFPIFLAAAAWYVCRAKQSNTLFLTLVAGVGLWTEYTLAWLLSDKPGFHVGGENVALGVGLFFAFDGLSKWLAGSKNSTSAADYGALLGLYVLRFTIITLFIFSFHYPWTAIISTGWKMPIPAFAISFLLCASAVWLAYKAEESIVSTAVFALLFLVGLLAIMQVEGKEYARSFQFADNIVLVGTGVWLITRGVQSSISHYFYLGVMTILTTGLLRYIDFIGDYVGTAILFAILAAILLGTARYWKSRMANTGTTS
ncbi:MAG: DUF2157 domain-containing protein [Syntrophobacter sp.]